MIVKKKNKRKFYFGYNKRILLNTIIFLIALTLTIIFISKAFNYYDSEIISYKENSELDYKVYLKENDFYEKEYLEKDMLYIASLIDNIEIDFNYQFNIDKIANIEFNYDIVAKLAITNEKDGKIYFEKEYELLKNKQYQMIENNNYQIKEQLKIDYNHYNNLANKFKQSYGIDVASNLLVYMKINKQSINTDLKLEDKNIMLITIPLSEKSIDIKMDYKEIDNSSHIVKEKDLILSNLTSMALAILCFVITVISMIKLIRLLSLLEQKKSKYDKYVKKILTEYDRVIVENTTGPDLVNNNVIKIKKFEELLDARDNFKLPIMYYTVTKHQKCYFYIKYNNDIYLMTIKAIDFEE